MNDPAWQLEMIRPLWPAVLLPILPLLVYYWWRSLVQFARWQRLVSLLLRVVLLAVLTVALSDVRLTQHSKRQFVVFAVDESLSIGSESRKAARAFVEKAVRQAGDHRTAYLTFADRPGEVGSELVPLSRETPPGTDLSEALLTSQLAIPATHVPRIVLLSDGNQTAGDARATARAATIPISTVPLPGRPRREVWVSAIPGKERVREGEPFYIEAVVGSTHDDQGTLRLTLGSETVAERQAPVHAGENRFRFRQTVLSRKEARFTLRLDGFHDELEQNNRASVTVRTVGKPRVLIIAGEPAAAAHLRPALESEAIEAQVVAPADAPADPAGLEQYDAVMLCNVPAASLSQQQTAALSDYVRRAGGGLIAVGGDRSFTPGGYRGTPLEEILPVVCEARRDKSKPSLAMVLVIDQSFSMQEGRKMELAKQATCQAIETLGPTDQIGVMAFEDTSRWISPLAPREDKPRLLERIGAIAAAGGTNMYPAMEKAYLALDEAFAQRKHMIVLSDGISHPGEFDRLARRMADSGVTVSTVAVGEQAAGSLLADVARLGGGHFYDCRDPADVPRVFITEAVSAGRLGITEEPFSPRAVNAEAVFWELDFAAAPALLGYVETRRKPAAEVILAASDEEPLLARWQCGAGIGIAFTSDAEDRWAAAWLRWNDFSRFWAQLVRHAVRPLPDDGEVEQTDSPPDYAAEFRVRPTNTALLRAIAEATGGRYDPKPSEVFAPSDRTVSRTARLWPHLLAAAAVLFVLDVMLKRIDLARRGRPRSERA